MATSRKENKAKPKRCMKCGKRFETNMEKCPYCGGRLTDKVDETRQYLAE